jgi:hypothetical protein
MSISLIDHNTTLTLTSQRARFEVHWVRAVGLVLPASPCQASSCPFRRDAALRCDRYHCSRPRRCVFDTLPLLSSPSLEMIPDE